MRQIFPLINITNSLPNDQPKFKNPLNHSDLMRPYCYIDLSHHLLRSLRWRHNERDSVSNHQPRDSLLKRLFRRRSKKTSKLRVTGLCAGNSPVTGEFHAQMASNAENVPIWWRHHVTAEDTQYPNNADSSSMWSVAFVWEQFHKTCLWT